MIKKAFYIDIKIKPEDIENAMRSRALKRTRPLDIKSSTSYSSSDGKYFLGYEKEKSLDFLRIRSPFEYFLPKMLINFKKENFNRYTLQFNPVSVIIFFLTVFVLILNLFYSLKEESDIYTILLFTGIFVVLTLIEVMINKYYIKKSLTKYLKS